MIKNPKLQALFEQAKKNISSDNLVSILCQLVDIPSPTGEEAKLAKHLVALLNDLGLAGIEQVIDAKQSNAIGNISGSSGGVKLLLYAPIDTVTSADAKADLPWAGPELRSDMLASSYVDKGHVFGLGAHNPKGHVACIIEAARVIQETQVPLAGGLKLGFGAGGMPTNARPGTRSDCGHGAGCNYMLSHETKPDCAIIAKSGWAIAWEEVGLVWFEVDVAGSHSYVGSRHILPYRSAINDAGRLIARLEDWFKVWSQSHSSGLVAPQGVVSFIESGWERMPAFTPASCRFRLDLRLNPDTSPKQAEQEFKETLERLCNTLDIKAKFRRIVAIPGTRTEPSEPVISQAIKAWETIEGSPHVAITGTSGATDANILRANGIPTARVGLPKAKLEGIDFQLGMNAVAITDLYKLTELLVYIAIDLCNMNTELANG